MGKRILEFQECSKKRGGKTKAASACRALRLLQLDDAQTWTSITRTGGCHTTLMDTVPEDRGRNLETGHAPGLQSMTSGNRVQR